MPQRLTYRKAYRPQESRRKSALITLSAAFEPPYLPSAHRGALRGSCGSSTDFKPRPPRLGLLLDVVPSAHMRKKCCPARRHAHFLGRSTSSPWKVPQWVLSVTSFHMGAGAL